MFIENYLQLNTHGTHIYHGNLKKVLHYIEYMYKVQQCDANIKLRYIDKTTAQIKARCMHDLESKFPAHHQQKTVRVA